MDPPPNFYSPPVFRYEKARCSQDIAAMTMKRVELRDFRATEDESYTADMKVNGDIVTRYEPAGECTDWVKPPVRRPSIMPALASSGVPPKPMMCRTTSGAL